MKNLTAMFLALSMAGPLVNMIWGDDLFARGCKTIAVPIQDLNTLLDMRNAKLKNAGGELYENNGLSDTQISVSVYDNNF